MFAVFLQFFQPELPANAREVSAEALREGEIAAFYPLEQDQDGFLQEVFGVFIGSGVLAGKAGYHRQELLVDVADAVAVVVQDGVEEKLVVVFRHVSRVAVVRGQGLLGHTKEINFQNRMVTFFPKPEPDCKYQMKAVGQRLVPSTPKAFFAKKP